MRMKVKILLVVLGSFLPCAQGNVQARAGSTSYYNITHGYCCAEYASGCNAAANTGGTTFIDTVDECEAAARALGWPSTSIDASSPEYAYYQTLRSHTECSSGHGSCACICNAAVGGYCIPDGSGQVLRNASQCLPGWYCEAGVRIAKRCPMDTFSEETGATSLGTCHSCPRGTSSKPGSNSIHDCVTYLEISSGYCTSDRTGSFFNRFGILWRARLPQKHWDGAIQERNPHTVTHMATGSAPLSRYPLTGAAGLLEIF